MSILLSQCCVLQKTYGKSQAEIETLVEGFNMILGDRDAMDDIQKAFMEYMKHNADIPAPSDIVKILKKIRHMKGVKVLL